MVNSFTQFMIFCSSSPIYYLQISCYLFKTNMCITDTLRTCPVLWCVRIASRPVEIIKLGASAIRVAEITEWRTISAATNYIIIMSSTAQSSSWLLLSNQPNYHFKYSNRCLWPKQAVQSMLMTLSIYSLIITRQRLQWRRQADTE